jgi:outer membrane cobalamin receptor
MVTIGVALVRPAILAAQFPPELRGRVTDATGGSLSGADVMVGDGLAVATTDVDGTFVIRGVLPGVASCRIRLVGFAPVERSVELANGVITRLTVALVPIPVRLATIESRTTITELVDATVLDRTRIAASGARELGQLLQGEAGVVVTQSGGVGSPATISIRGSEAHQVLVLLDGVPINDAVTGAADLSTIPLGSIARVTIVRGAQSARYGAQALAGVVLVETSRPDRTELEGQAGVGSYGERLASGSAATRGRLGATVLGGRIGAEWRQATGDFPYDMPVERGGGSTRRGNADARIVDVTASGTAVRGATDVRARLELFDADRGMPGSIVQPSLFARQTQRRLGLASSVQAPLGAWQLTIDGDVQHQRATFTDTLPPFTAPYADRTSVTAVRVAAQAAGRVATLAASVGAEARRTGFAATTLAAASPTSQRQVGVYGSLARAIPLGRRWQLDLSGGGRLDEGSVLDAVAFSPRAAAAIGTDHLTLRASWGRAFSPPSLADQFFQEGVQVRPNPLLKPERVRGEVTIGVDVRALTLGPLHADVSGTAFRADVKGMILWFPDFRYIWQPDNFDVTRRGLEFSTRVTAAPAHLAWTGAVAATQVQYAGPVLTGQVIYRPVWTASSRITATIARVDFDLAWRLTGSRRTAVATALNALPAFRLVDLHAARPLLTGPVEVQVRGGIENLFGRRAAMLIDYPLAGRTFMLALRVRRGPSR